MSQPTNGTATKAETGRSCPYCRFPLKEGDAMTECGDCSSPHHSECWHDNQGCAIVACASGPQQATAQTHAAPMAAAPPPPPYQPATAAYRPAPSPAALQPHAAAPMPSPGRHDDDRGRRNSNNPWLIVSVLVLAMVVVGAATVIVLSQNSEPTVAAQAAEETRTVTVDEDATPAPTELDDPQSSTAGSRGPDALADGETEQIRQLLLDHHAAIVSQDFDTAWDLLTDRKRESFLNRDGGYGAWVEGQRTLSSYLGPDGLSVTVQDVDEETDVARVDVQGMSWSKPGASCSTWSGVTWVRFENDGWYYDPGYSTTPQRESEWAGRFGELLGGSC